MMGDDEAQDTGRLRHREKTEREDDSRTLDSAARESLSLGNI